MINQIVFFIGRPLNKRDYLRFGAPIFMHNGFDVLFWDFSPFLYPEIFKQSSTNLSTDDGIRTLEKTFHTEKEAVDAILRLRKTTFVIPIIHYSFLTYAVFRALSKTDVMYGRQVLNDIPVYNVNNSKVEELQSRIKQKRISQIPVTVRNTVFRPRFAKFLGIKPPRFLFAGGFKSLENIQATAKNNSTKIIWAHTFDYDLYLDHYLNQGSNIEDLPEKFAVFIDSPTPKFKRDSVMPGVFNHLTEKQYYPSLCRFFDAVETYFDLSVVIAGHPGSQHEKYPRYFGKRLTVSGKTCELVLNSQLVVNRDSTAINFAVLSEKPVISTTSKEAEQHPENYLYWSIRSMASWIGKSPVNIDDSQDLWDFKKEEVINKKAYADYARSYIKYKGALDKKAWEIVSDQLKGI